MYKDVRDVFCTLSVSHVHCLVHVRLCILLLICPHPCPPFLFWLVQELICLVHV